MGPYTVKTQYFIVYVLHYTCPTNKIETERCAHVYGLCVYIKLDIYARS